MAFHHNGCEKYLLPSHERRRGNIASSVNVNQEQDPKILEDSGSYHCYRLYLMVFSTLANVKKKKKRKKENGVLRKSLFPVKVLLFICVIQNKIILIQKTKKKIIKIKKLKKKHKALTVVDPCSVSL